MQIVILIFLVLIFIKLSKDNLAIFLSRKWLKQKPFSCNNPDLKFLIFIPIFNIKKDDLYACISHFVKFNDTDSIVFIGTKKDKNKNIRKYRDLIKSIKNEKISLLICPNKKGNKSDQLNFGVNFLSKNKKYNPEKTFILIYDIDSRPSLDTITQLSSDKDINYVNVYQQSAIFLNNYFSPNVDLNQKLIQLFSIEQCRFTFAHEIPKLHFYFNTISKPFLNNFIYAHCVGHGLIIRESFLKKYPLPSFYPEDMFYGFILNIIRESIKPLNVLDESNMPSTFKQLFIQRANWFIGPSYGIGYTSFFRKKYPNEIINKKLKIFFLNINSIYLGIKWLLTTPVFIFLVINLFSNIFIIKIIAMLSIVSYMLSYFNVIYSLKKIKHSLKAKFVKLKFSDQFRIIFYSLIHLSIHSFTAYYKILNSIKEKKIARI
jgi:hypothetical protein